MNKDEFVENFVERTKKILCDYKGECEVTLLLNCLLGLIVFVYEDSKNVQATDHSTNIGDMADLIWIRSTSSFFFEPKKINKKRGIVDQEKTLSIFLSKIRHGIAHKHIEPINENGDWVGIRLWNEYNENRDKDLELVLSSDQLRDLAIYISGKYLGNKRNSRVCCLR